MRIAICEDEQYWIEALQDSVLAWGISKGVKPDIDCFINPNDLIEGILSASYDILLLDIALGKAVMDGMETAGYLRKTGNKIPIIFVTSIDSRADEGYLVEAMGYLKKPIDESKLTLFLDRALKNKKPLKMIEVDTENGVKIIPDADIVYAEVLNKMIYCHTNNDVISFRGTISQFFNQLGDNGFMLVHRAFLIAKDKIYGVKPSYPYGVTLIKGNSTVEVPLSRKYVNKVLEVYSNDVLRRMG